MNGERLYKRRSCNVTGKVIKGGSVGGSGTLRKERGVEEGVCTLLLLVDVTDGNVIPLLCFDTIGIVSHRQKARQLLGLFSRRE